MRFERSREQNSDERLGRRDYINAFTSHTDGKGRAYFRIGGKAFDVDAGEGTDIYAAEQGFISVTPLNFDAADYEAIVELRKIFRG